MPGTDSPQGSGADTPLSFDQGVAAIEGFLSSVPDEQETAGQDSAQDDESQTEGQKAEAKAESEGGKPEEENDDDLELELDASDEGKPAPDEPAFKAGQFASRDAKVKLDDGTTISVADLIANGMFQTTFTKKTTELSADRKALDTEKSDFAETKKQVEHQRNVLLTLANELMPKEPQAVDPNEDPAAYLAYLAERDAYQSKMARLQQLWQGSQGEKSKAEEKQQKDQAEADEKRANELQEWATGETAKFYERYPKFKNEDAKKQWATDLFEVGAKHYGFSEEELAAIFDHRHLSVITDAIAFRKAVAKRDAGQKAPQPVQQQARIPQKQRMAPQTTQARDSATATDRLRKTGSQFDAVKALEKFV